MTSSGAGLQQIRGLGREVHPLDPHPIGRREEVPASFAGARLSAVGPGVLVDGARLASRVESLCDGAQFLDRLRGLETQLVEDVLAVPEQEVLGREGQVDERPGLGVGARVAAGDDAGGVVIDAVPRGIGQRRVIQERLERLEVVPRNELLAVADAHIADAVLAGPTLEVDELRVLAVRVVELREVHRDPGQLLEAVDRGRVDVRDRHRRGQDVQGRTVELTPVDVAPLPILGAGDWRQRRHEGQSGHRDHRTGRGSHPNRGCTLLFISGRSALGRRRRQLGIGRSDPTLAMSGVGSNWGPPPFPRIDGRCRPSVPLGSDAASPGRSVYCICTMNSTGRSGGSSRGDPAVRRLGPQGRGGVALAIGSGS